MFEYKSGGYTRRLQGAFIIIAVVVALCAGLGPGVAELLKGRPQFGDIY